MIIFYYVQLADRDYEQLSALFSRHSYFESLKGNWNIFVFHETKCVSY
jgi:hypothetical protein